jgi:hypothetical protein
LAPQGALWRRRAPFGAFGGILQSVELCDIPTDKAGLIARLNNEPITQTDNG